MRNSWTVRISDPAATSAFPARPSRWVGQQPVRHVPLAMLISGRIGQGRFIGQLQVQVRIQVHAQRHRRLARITPRF
jgi:hypothetical protein